MHALSSVTSTDSDSCKANIKLSILVAEEIKLSDGREAPSANGQIFGSIHAEACLLTVDSRGMAAPWKIIGCLPQ